MTVLEFFTKRMRGVRKDEKGFTLIELLVVIIIIGLLAAIAIPTFLNQRTKAWDATAKSDLRSATTFIEAHYTENGTYGTDLAGLRDQGFRPSADTTTTVVSGNATTFCLRTKHDKGGSTWYTSGGTRYPTDTACT